MGAMRWFFFVFIFLKAISSGNAEIEGADVDVQLFRLDDDKIPAEVTEVAVAHDLNVLRLRLINTSKAPLRLIWGDFFVRVGGGEWIGGWWRAGEHELAKIAAIAGRERDDLGVLLPPGMETGGILTDPWISENGAMEYKFVGVFCRDDGDVLVAESPAAQAEPVKIEKSGVLRAVSGVMGAVEGALVKDEPKTGGGDLGEDGGFSVSLQHQPLGTIEAIKNRVLMEELKSWLVRKELVGGDFYVYQTEIANNTTEEVKLAVVEISTLHDGAWISGADTSPLIFEKELISKGYIRKVGEDGQLTLSAMKDAWIPPGGRAIFPSCWHPSTDVNTLERARWKAVLLGRGGRPIYVHGETPSIKANFFTPSGEGG
jgi:hypothetical protein